MLRIVLRNQKLILERPTCDHMAANQRRRSRPSGQPGCRRSIFAQRNLPEASPSLADTFNQDLVVDDKIILSSEDVYQLFKNSGSYTNFAVQVVKRFLPEKSERKKFNCQGVRGKNKFGPNVLSFINNAVKKLYSVNDYPTVVIKIRKAIDGVLRH